WLAGGRGRLLLGYMAAATVGAVLGGFLAAVSLGLNIADIDTTSLLVATVGAAVLLVILHALPAAEVFD
ncbi:MAG: GlsB/YeaQ/YmgE family stress response membrane protein, partial [Chloroflexi bacterium]|nr:GlsB/YeaQ/YmgE family stress response membrane protein [Chloroflexota bacterium]